MSFVAFVLFAFTENTVAFSSVALHLAVGTGFPRSSARSLCGRHRTAEPARGRHGSVSKRQRSRLRARPTPHWLHDRRMGILGSPGDERAHSAAAGGGVCDAGRERSSGNSSILALIRLVNTQSLSYEPGVVKEHSIDRFCSRARRAKSVTVQTFHDWKPRIRRQLARNLGTG